MKEEIFCWFMAWRPHSSKTRTGVHESPSPLLHGHIEECGNEQCVLAHGSALQQLAENRNIAQESSRLADLDPQPIFKTSVDLQPQTLGIEPPSLKSTMHAQHVFQIDGDNPMEVPEAPFSAFVIN